MPKSSALPWVKAYTRVFASPKWLALPMDERGVFDHLTRLGGVGSKRGYVEGTDDEIAKTMGCATRLFTATIERFSKPPWKSMRRTRRGIVLVNWSEYNPPPAWDPDYHKQRRANGSPTSSAISVLMANGEEEVNGEKVERALASLRQIPGWPYDEDRDRPHLIGLLSGFPSVDPQRVITDLAAWSLDNGLGKNPRLRLSNFFRKALEFQARDASRLTVVKAIPTPAEQEARLRERMRGA